MKIVASIKQRWAVWVWQHTPHCTDMARLASRSCEQPLSLRIRLQMRLHFLICAWCERYDRQLKFLHHASSQLERHDDKLPGRGLSAEARQRILRRLTSADDKNL